MIDVGLIGMGYWGNILLEKLKKFCKVDFVCSGREPSDYIDNISKVRWVFIATPNHTHYEIVKNCLSNTVNVFCEKPLTYNFRRSEELYKLSQQRDRKLYVDDVFWFRDESKRISSYIHNFKIDSIRFINKKYGSFKDNIFNNLVYHDLCILYYLFGHLNYKNLKFSKNEFNHKEFEFSLENVRLWFLYDRLSKERDKKIFIDESSFDYNNPTNDALEDMLHNVLSYNVDFERNKLMCLSVDNVLEELNKLEG